MVLRWAVNRVRESIHAKFITLFILFLVIPLFLLSGFFTIRLRTLLMEKETQNAVDKIDTSINQVDAILREMSDLCSALILNYNLMEILNSNLEIPTYEWFQEYRSFENLLQSLASKSQRSYSITVLSQNGRLYRSGAQYNSMLTTDHPLVRMLVKDKNSSFLLNRRLEGIDDHNIITLVKAIFKNNALLGVILIDVSASEFAPIFSTYERTDSRVYVLDEEKRLLYTADSEVQISVLSEELHEILFSKDDRIEIGKTRYTRIVQTSSNSHISIGVLLSEDEIYGESNRQMLTLAFWLLAVILSTIVMITVLSTRISRNIKRLSNAVDCFGRTGERITLDTVSRDEVGRLTEGFKVMSRQIHDLLECVREDERTKWQLEFKALQAQINPHMIYNTLNTITYLAHIQNVPNIEEVSASFAGLLRMVSKREQAWISIEDELECVRSYLVIKKYNMLMELETEIHAEPATLNLRILKLLLQPLVENACIHGFSGGPVEGKITLRVGLAQNRVHILLSDNGVGMDSQTLCRIRQGKSLPGNAFSKIGVYNTMQRLHLQYGDNASMDIDSIPGQGTQIKIEFPAEPVEEESP